MLETKLNDAKLLTNSRKSITKRKVLVRVIIPWHRKTNSRESVMLHLVGHSEKTKPWRKYYGLKSMKHCVHSATFECLTFSKEYWQLAITRQNWKTQKSLKQPWLRSTNPRKDTRKAIKIATRFSRKSWFLWKKTQLTAAFRGKKGNYGN